MNKIGLIIQREFLNRVQKKSFLIATILIPLIFPAIIGLLAYISVQSEKGAKKRLFSMSMKAGLLKPIHQNMILEIFQAHWKMPKKHSMVLMISVCSIFPITRFINQRI